MSEETMTREAASKRYPFAIDFFIRADFIEVVTLIVVAIGAVTFASFMLRIAI